METQLVVDVALVDGPVRPDDAAARDATPECGAEAVFVGRTRGEGHEVFGELIALDYEAYREMAEEMIARIAREEGTRRGCRFVGVRHSVGRVRVGEASVLVRVLGRGRDEAFDVCRAVIDRLKSEAPIWKKEEWSTGATWREDVPVVVLGTALHTTERAP